MNRYEANDAIREAFAIIAGEMSTSVTDDVKFAQRAEDVISTIEQALDDEYAFGYEAGQMEYVCEDEHVTHNYSCKCECGE